MHRILSQPKARRTSAKKLDLVETALLSAYRAHHWTRSTRSAIDSELFDDEPKRRVTFLREARRGGA